MAEDEFDDVIVGGGSAGCVLAARLSDDPQVRVALLEAGGDGRGPLVDIPAGTVAMLPTRLDDWAFETEPQPGLGGRRGYQPRGQALGGSSAIDAMVYGHGHRTDFGRGARSGNPGWSDDDVLPCFVKAEDNERLAAPDHGRGGPLAVSDAELRVCRVSGLRVADASGMPAIVGGSTHAATVMVVDKAPDLILGRHVSTDSSLRRRLQPVPTPAHHDPEVTDVPTRRAGVPA